MSSLAAPPVRIEPPTSTTPTPPDKKDPSADCGYFTPSPRRVGTGESYTQFNQSQTSSIQSLLRTPSEPLVKQDGGYFAARSARSSSRHTRVISPSDNPSDLLCLSPGFSSTGSAHSSSTCYSQGSSDYLSPPLFQADCDNPPYRPRRGSVEGLTLMPQPRRAHTMPDGKRRNLKREHKKSRKCRRKQFQMHEHQARSYWWLPGCQTAPTAPSSQRQLCEGRTGKFAPRNTRRGNIDTYGRLSPKIKPGPIYSPITRRWSSVEVGAHRVSLESSFSLRATSDESMKQISRDDSSTPINHGQRYRSSTFSRSDTEHDIIRTVRERLTLREVRPTQLATPASITLRRASGVSADTDVFAPSSEGGGQDLYQEQLSTTYLITAKDIDTITELIEANLKRKFEDEGEGSRIATSADTHTGQNVRSQSFKSKISDKSKRFSSDSAVATSESSSTQIALDYLRVNPTYKSRNNTLRRSGSQKSVHEILWEGKASPPSASSVTGDDDSKRSPSCVCSEPITPGRSSEPHACRPMQTNQESQLKGNAFDPKNAHSSISEWSWSCSQNEIALIITSSKDEGNKQDTECKEGREDDQKREDEGDSKYKGSKEDEINRIRPSRLPKDRPRSPPTRTGSPSRERVKVRPFSRYPGSSKQLREVESFPALPRKTTNDWFSPLPEINSPVLVTGFQPLYDIGLDITCGPSASRELTPRAPQSPRMVSAQLSPRRNAECDFDDDVSKNSDVRTTDIRQKNVEVQSDNARSKGFTKSYPKAPARTGSPSTIGSSIGISTGERKRSTKTPPPVPAKSSSDHRPNSTPDLIHVRTIDNILKKEHNDPCMKWRKPSVCPPRQTPSPSEYEDAQEERSSSPDPMPISPRPRYSLANRLSLIQDFSPLIGKLDHVGIYGQITGAKKKPMTGEPCVQKEEMDGDAHRCEICKNSMRKTPSTDWIG